MVPLTLAAFVAGVFLLQNQADLPSVPALVVAATAALAVAAAAAATARSRPGVAGALFVAAGTIAGFVHAATVATLRMSEALPEEVEGRDVRLTGVVASLPAQLERGVRFEFDVQAVHTEGVQVPGRLMLGWYAPAPDVRAGSRWALTVRLRRPHGTLNPGGFDLEAWLLERNVGATGYVRTGRLDEAPRRLDDLVPRAGYLIDRVRDVMRERLQRRLADARYGGVLVALVLGDQRAIREEDWLLFNRTGISHLVAISGLHITMIAGLFAVIAAGLWRRSPLLLRWAPVQSAAAVTAVAAAFLYCLLAGWGVPAQRTFFMLATVAAALLLRRAGGAATPLLAAAAVVCALDPWAAIAPGFWLSFGAVAAILWVVRGRGSTRPTGMLARLREAGRVQLAVTVALVPLTVILFRQISVVAPLANAVAIPLVSLAITPLALTAAACVMLPEPLASMAVPLLAVGHWLFASMATALLWLVQLPAATVPLAAPPWWTIPPALLGVSWLLAPRGWPLRGLGAAWLLPMLLWPASRPHPGELWVTALDVGQGMAVLVETQRHRLLYDTGPRYSAQADAGGRLIAPYLRWRGIDRLDLMVVSHLDSDHSGGAASLLRSLPVARVVSSVPQGSIPVRQAREFARCEAGDTFDLGAARVRLLHPPAEDYARGGRPTNAMSCVLEVSLADHRVLLTGDLPAREEAALARSGLLGPATVLTAPHHGSRHSSSAALIEATRPRWVVVQAGYRNRFGHPDPAVVERYRAAGATVLRTDQSGALQWRLAADGTVRVSRWRELGARYWHHRPGRPAPEGDLLDDSDASPSTYGAPAVVPEGATPF